MDARTAVQKQIRAWNTDDEGERLRLLREACVEDAEFVSPHGVSHGVAELAQGIGEFRRANPKARVVHGPTEEHHGYARFAWTTHFLDDRASLHGWDFVEFDPKGRIRRLVSFDGRGPSEPE